MLHYRTGSPRPLPTIVADTWLVTTCTALHACFFLRIVHVFPPPPDLNSLSLLLPTSVPRSLPPVSYITCFVPSYRCSCFLGLPPLGISSSCLMWVVDSTASAAVFVHCSWCCLPTGSLTCNAVAVGTWSAMMGAPFCWPHGRSAGRSPSRKKYRAVPILGVQSQDCCKGLGITLPSSEASIVGTILLKSQLGMPRGALSEVA